MLTKDSEEKSAHQALRYENRQADKEVRKTTSPVCHQGLRK